MRNGLARLKEEFPDEHADIALNLACAIREDNVGALQQIISRYFSSTETVGFLDAAIAVFADNVDDEKAHIEVPAALAVMAGSRNALRTILRVTRNPNARKDPITPENSLTLLMQAVLNSDIEMVKLLLEEGANPNEECVVIEENGAKTPANALSMAIELGLSKTAGLLLNAGVIPTFEAAIQAALSPLTSGDNSIPLERIVSIRPSLIHEHDERTGMTLLHWAVCGSSLLSIKWLVDQGAEVNAATNYGETPLDTAIEQGKIDIVDYLKNMGGIQGSQKSQTNIHDAENLKQEITKNIERLELLEEKFGIAISGLYANYETGNSAYPHIVKINFDLTSLSGGKLERSFKVLASAYNSAGQLLRTESTRIDADDFMGFCPVSITLYDLDQPPEKIRLFPSA